MIQLDHNVPSWPLHEQPISVPKRAESVWLRVDVDTLVYRYSYSFDGETWHTVPVTYEAWKLSDDYIGGRGFFTGAFWDCTARTSAATAATLTSTTSPTSRSDGSGRVAQRA
ncbi:beta-xylosidase family glycoside hydrolase [Enterobacter hormaechei]